MKRAGEVLWLALAMVSVVLSLQATLTDDYAKAAYFLLLALYLGGTFDRSAR